MILRFVGGSELEVFSAREEIRPSTQGGSVLYRVLVQKSGKDGMTIDDLYAFLTQDKLSTIEVVDGGVVIGTFSGYTVVESVVRLLPSDVICVWLCRPSS